LQADMPEIVGIVKRNEQFYLFPASIDESRSRSE
jgi:hypothetical protein